VPVLHVFPYEASSGSSDGGAGDGGAAAAAISQQPSATARTPRATFGSNASSHFFASLIVRASVSREPELAADGG